MAALQYFNYCSEGKEKKGRVEMDASSHRPFLATLHLLETIAHKESQAGVVN